MIDQKIDISDDLIKCYMLISEIFASKQGEGPASGRTSIFVRGSGCNLRCMHCDTAQKNQKRDMTVAEVVADVRRIASNMKAKPRIIITGGEPTLQFNDFALVCDALNDFPLDIETNGMIDVPNSFISKFRLYVISPKKNAFKSDADRREFFNRWSKHTNVVFKFVSGSYDWCYNTAEISELIEKFNLNRDRICVMPAGATKLELDRNTSGAWKSSMRLDVTFSDRLQVRADGR